MHQNCCTADAQNEDYWLLFAQWGSENGTLELCVLMEVQGVSKPMRLLKRLSFLTEMTHESDFAQGDRWDVELRESMNKQQFGETQKCFALFSRFSIMLHWIVHASFFNLVHFYQKMKFSDEQRKFIILQFAKGLTAIAVKQEFLETYAIWGRQRSKFTFTDFQREWQRFKTGLWTG